MKILIINGPNLNMLGKRDADIYGTLTLDQINEKLDQQSKILGTALLFFQSNHEGAIIDFLQKESSLADGILINPGALTHYGYALRDALADTRLPIVEVHLSDISNREDFRKVDVIKDLAVEIFMGQKDQSYMLGLEKLVAHIQKNGTLT